MHRSGGSAPETAKPVILREIMNRGGSEHLDVITFHVYTSNDHKVMRIVENTIEPILRQAGMMGKPRWVTETGCNTGEEYTMPLINLSVQHGQSVEEARSRLEAAVDKVTGQFGALVRQVTWSADRSRVRIDGRGFWVELWVDAQAVHATGDIPLLGALLGRPVEAGLKQILQQTFRKQLT
jgi:Putative polyhydroxyalkanoic acid system protein (PHA_gran_rgn)